MLCCGLLLYGVFCWYVCCLEPPVWSALALLPIESRCVDAVGFLACRRSGLLLLLPFWVVRSSVGVTKRRNSWACIDNPNPEQETIKGTHAQETSAYQRRATTHYAALGSNPPNWDATHAASEDTTHTSNHTACHQGRKRRPARHQPRAQQAPSQHTHN